MEHDGIGIGLLSRRAPGTPEAKLLPLPEDWGEDLGSECLVDRGVPEKLCDVDGERVLERFVLILVLEKKFLVLLVGLDVPCIHPRCQASLDVIFLVTGALYTEQSLDSLEQCLKFVHKSP